MLSIGLTQENRDVKHQHKQTKICCENKDFFIINKSGYKFGTKFETTGIMPQVFI